MREINGERLRMHLKGNSGITEKMYDIAMYLALRIRDVKLLTVVSSSRLSSSAQGQAFLLTSVRWSACHHAGDTARTWWQLALSVQLPNATSAFQLNAADRRLFFR